MIKRKYMWRPNKLARWRKKKDASSERTDEGQGHDAGEDREVDQVAIGEIRNVLGPS